MDDVLIMRQTDVAIKNNDANYMYYLLLIIAIFLEYHHVTDTGYSNYSEAQNDSSYQYRGLTGTLYQFPH